MPATRSPFESITHLYGSPAAGEDGGEIVGEDVLSGSWEEIVGEDVFSEVGGAVVGGEDVGGDEVWEAVGGAVVGGDEAGGTVGAQNSSLGSGNSHLGPLSLESS